jgi:hypothetical protein
MSESYFEDLNDSFPINNQVRCGQSAFQLGFANMTLDESEQLQPAHLQRARRGASPRGYRRKSNLAQ